MDNLVVYEDNVIVVAGRRTLFKYNIAKVEINDSHIFVLLHIPRKAEVPANEACNVLSFDHSGSIEWRIKSDPTSDSQESTNHHYYGLTLDSDNKLFVTNSSRIRFEVNQETGALSKKAKLFDYKENEFVIAGKRTIFKYDIGEVQMSDKHIYVLLRIPMGIKLTSEEVCNVFSFDYFGNLEWRVKNIPPRGFWHFKGMPFEGMYLDQNDTFFATDFMGVMSQIDQETGVMGEAILVK